MRWGTLARQHPFVALRRLGVLISLAVGAGLFAVSPALADDRPDGSELATAGSMMVVIVLFFVVAVTGIWFSWGNGEFAEPEESKYEMLAMTEDEVDFWGVGSHDDDDDDEIAERPLLAKPVVS